MEDLYGILGCSATASAEEIKACVKAARLRYHPDRSREVTSGHDQFVAIERAWAVLRSPELRKRYDNIRAQDDLMRNTAKAPIQMDLNLDEFTFDPFDTDQAHCAGPVGPDGLYWSPCRCGGHYVLDSVAVCCKAPFVPCTDCSLVVRVLYPE